MTMLFLLYFHVKAGCQSSPRRLISPPRHCMSKLVEQKTRENFCPGDGLNPQPAGSRFNQLTTIAHQLTY